MSERRRFASLKEFWPFYLGEHRSRVNRGLHAVGSLGAIAWIVVAVVKSCWWALALSPVTGYGFAWVGHFVFERNRPATFGEPLKSFICDWIMLSYILTGRIGRELAKLPPPDPTAPRPPDARPASEPASTETAPTGA